MKTADELFELIKESKFVLEKIQRRNYDSSHLLEISFGEWVVIGDLHGDHETLTSILEKTGFPKRARECDYVYLLCLGDYIDRGPKQIEVLETLLELMCAHPKQVFLLRGNHEGPRDIPVEPHDFPQVLRRRYPEDWIELYQAFCDLFDELWTACLFPGELFFVHGGLPSRIESMNDIKVAHLRHPDDETLEELLWNDPCKINGFSYNYRGFGKCFGSDVLMNFRKLAGVDVVVRGHEPLYEHIDTDMDTFLITLHSCFLPEYGYTDPNYMVLPHYRKFTGYKYRETIKTIYKNKHPFFL